MKYSRKQIERGYKAWITETRLNPTGFESDEEDLARNVGKSAKVKAQTLIDYINQS